MVHIAKDCQAAGVLTSKDYHASLKTNLARSGVAASGVDVDYISGLPWIVTEDVYKRQGSASHGFYGDHSRSAKLRGQVEFVAHLVLALSSTDSWVSHPSRILRRVGLEPQLTSVGISFSKDASSP